jgi:hypothetical protein
LHGFRKDPEVIFTVDALVIPDQNPGATRFAFSYDHGNNVMSIGQFRKKIELIIFSHKIKQMKHLALEK